MRRLCLVHWDIAEAEKKAPGLRALGYEVECAAPRGYPSLKPLRDSPPDVMVIDLSRRPAYGRDIAQELRRYKDTRNVPLVLLGGESENVGQIRERLPDAVYADWEEVACALEEARSPRPGLAGGSSVTDGRLLWDAAAAKARPEARIDCRAAWRA